MRISRSLTRQSSLSQVIDDCLEVTETPGHRPIVPCGPVMVRGRVRTDVVAMLGHRMHCRLLGPMYRYVCCDASPQHEQSLEVFVSSERVIARAAVGSRQATEVPGYEMQHRLLPIATLGQGHTDVRNKAEALLHQTWLEYGPSADDLRASATDVRQVLTDMGTEFAIADTDDFIDAYLEKSARPSGKTPQLLYPFALQVPGSQHIIDGIVRETVEQLPWWPAWQEAAKRVLQHAHGQNARGHMQHTIQKHCEDATERDRMVASLGKATGRFARWRWRTLQGATDDLLRIIKGCGALCLRGQGQGRCIGPRGSGHRGSEGALARGPGPIDLGHRQGHFISHRAVDGVHVLVAGL